MVRRFCFTPIPFLVLMFRLFPCFLSSSSRIACSLRCHELTRVYERTTRDWERRFTGGVHGWDSGCFATEFDIFFDYWYVSISSFTFSIGPSELERGPELLLNLWVHFTLIKSELTEVRQLALGFRKVRRALFMIRGKVPADRLRVQSDFGRFMRLLLHRVSGYARAHFASARRNVRRH